MRHRPISKSDRLRTLTRIDCASSTTSFVRTCQGPRGGRALQPSFDDPAFDARTYLVAVTPAGELVGLVRIWMNPGRPRLGLLGVRREWRRRGIAWLLLRRALAAVEGHGGTEVVAEFDVGNAASGAIAERLGARRIATRIELAHQPGTRGRGPCAEKTHHAA